MIIIRHSIARCCRILSLIIYKYCSPHLPAHSPLLEQVNYGLATSCILIEKLSQLIVNSVIGALMLPVLILLTICTFPFWFPLASLCLFQVSLIYIKNNCQLFQLSKFVQFILNYDPSLKWKSIRKHSIKRLPTISVLLRGGGRINKCHWATEGACSELFYTLAGKHFSKPFSKQQQQQRQQQENKCKNIFIIYSWQLQQCGGAHSTGSKMFWKKSRQRRCSWRDAAALPG